jgi:toxin-antitoxin system PIN domain toxin
VIVPDVNLLLYAQVPGFREHAAARRWWEDLLSGESDVGLGTIALFGFVRLATSRTLLARPMPVSEALTRLDDWLARPRVRFLLPGPRHLEIAFALLRELGTGGNLTTDVQLAALAIENQAELHSNDTDFARFPGLRWVNPLR